MTVLKDPLPYDKTSPEDILRYSKLLEGTKFRNVLDGCGPDCRFKDDKGKGRLGQLLEECHFFYMPNSDMKADFEEAGVELKTTPIKK
ncbi:MAG: restriction endonuclease, partial [Candidatus Aenigmarchaeota archaeon]|nr:restriction endonuclease [Candidatus Aenigmarchaeota archaeon]